MAQAEDEQHLHGPGADAPDHGEPLDHLFDGRLTEHLDRRHGTLDRVTREVPDGPGLGLREPGAPELLVRRGVHHVRGREAFLRVERQKAAQDRRSGLAGQLLIHDRAGERGEGAVGRRGAGQPEGSDPLDVPAQHRIAAAELRHYRGQVDRLDAGLGPEAGDGHGARRITEPGPERPARALRLRAMARDVALTLAGGGNRAFYQAGLLRHWWPRLEPRVGAIGSCSAGASMAVSLMTGREREATAFWHRRRAHVTRNFEWLRLLRGERPTPHTPVYRDTLRHSLSEGGFERLRAARTPSSSSPPCRRAGSPCRRRSSSG